MITKIPDMVIFLNTISRIKGRRGDKGKSGRGKLTPETKKKKLAFPNGPSFSGLGEAESKYTLRQSVRWCQAFECLFRK